MKQGFSLVELSIVLVILGLLTGGILGGQALIRSAELRAITTEYDKYQTAINTFKDKYFQLPGDMTNAIAFWGDNTTHCDDGDATNNGSPGTCNGDGDGAMESSPAPSVEGENFMFWQHLAYAGLIEGTYTGICGAGTRWNHDLGVNAPRSRLSSAGWGINGPTNQPTVDAYDLSSAGEYGNMLYYGGESANNTEPHAPVLTPEEAWNVDTKIDDGLPASGILVAFYWDDECGTANDGGSADDDLDARYNLAESSVQCALAFRHAIR
ncbi:MAG: prepilin-type N-terminal cleavage/methylation domain-containing protein [Rickettsiales bacterium]